MSRDTSASNVLDNGNLRWTDEEEKEMVEFVDQLKGFELTQKEACQKASKPFQRTAEAIESRYKKAKRRERSDKEDSIKPAPLLNPDRFNDVNDAINYIRNRCIKLEEENLKLQEQLSEKNQSSADISDLEAKVESLNNQVAIWKQKAEELDAENKTLLSDQQFLATFMQRHAKHNEQTNETVSDNQQLQLQLVK